MLRISNVTENTQSHDRGLEAGDFIYEANGEEIRSEFHFLAILEKIKITSEQIQTVIFKGNKAKIIYFNTGSPIGIQFAKNEYFKMTKIVHIPAYFKPIGENRMIKIETGETEKGLFGGKKAVTRNVEKYFVTGKSDCIVDSERLALDLSNAIADLNNSGFDIVTVTPVISGKYDSFSEGKSSGLGSPNPGQAYGISYGYGYSYTDSLIIIAKKNQ